MFRVLPCQSCCRKQLLPRHSDKYSWPLRGGRCTIRAMAAAMQQHGTSDALLAVVGDIHGLWADQDMAALQFLRDGRVHGGFLTCLVGDFGNEDVEIVRKISELEEPKVAILGNHDAWSTMRKTKVKPQPLAPGALCPADALRLGPAQAEAACRELEGALPGGAANGVLQQLRLLGPAHVGLSAFQVAGTAISIVGSRPFSQGGQKWSSVASLTGLLYGVTSLAEAAGRLVEVARAEAGEGRVVVIMGHNAPQGLGSAAYNICGIDWQASSGDHGDPDLRMALDMMRDQGLSVPLVLCGHMHHKLYGGKALRRMVHVDPGSGCVTLNAATVPRVRSASGGEAGATERHFLTVQLRDGLVHSAHDTWVRVQASGSGWECQIAEQQEVLALQAGEAGATYRCWDANRQRFVPVFVPGLQATPPSGMQADKTAFKQYIAAL